MIRKTQIFSLILLFFISTTGLPVFSHYCEMMGRKSLSECEVCTAEKEETFSCYSEETPEYPVKISSEKPVCCQDEFVYHKVEDEFLFNKAEAKVFITVEHSIITSVSPADFSQNLLTQKYLISSSPPKFLTNDIYLNNSVFLI
jgi:hypothetical protein